MRFSDCGAAGCAAVRRPSRATATRTCWRSESSPCRHAADRCRRAGPRPTRRSLRPDCRARGPSKRPSGSPRLASRANEACDRSRSRASVPAAIRPLTRKRRPVSDALSAQTLVGGQIVLPTGRGAAVGHIAVTPATIAPPIAIFLPVVIAVGRAVLPDWRVNCTQCVRWNRTLSRCHVLADMNVRPPVKSAARVADYSSVGAMRQGESTRKTTIPGGIASLRLASAALKLPAVGGNVTAWQAGASECRAATCR